MGSKKSYPYFHLILRMLTICLLVGWMGVIFMFSEQPGDESGDLSGHISYRICEITNDLFHLGWSSEETLNRAEKIDYPVRKLAHMSEYGILAVFAFFAIIAWPIKGKRIYWFPLCLCVIYASSDEIHQLFVPDRAGRVTDVLIDSCGAVIALLIIWGIMSLVNKKNKML